MNHDCPLSCTEVELATFPSDGFTISSEGCSEVNKPERNLVNLTFVSWTVKFFFSTSRLARLETLPSIQNLQRFVTTNKMLSCKDLINFRLNINFFLNLTLLLCIVGLQLTTLLLMSIVDAQQFYAKLQRVAQLISLITLDLRVHCNLVQNLQQMSFGSGIS